MAVENENLETLQMLLEERSVLWNLYRPDVNERVPLHYAAMVKDIRVGKRKYGFLLSNYSEYRPNNSANIQRYLYSRKPVCRTGRRAHAKLSHSPSFIDKFIDYSSWIINLLLVVCSIAVYFYSLFVY